MSTKGKIFNTGLVVVVVCFVLMIASSLVAEEAKYAVLWGSRFQTLTIRFAGEEYQYPRDMLADPFPKPGELPYVVMERNWPLVLMWARWAVSMEGFPEKYRPYVLDIILMFACDVQLYQHVFPKMIRSAKFIFPPEFIEAAKEGFGYNLVEKMRGEVVSYEVMAKAGFGASDYKMKTQMRVGASDDWKTVFYYDSPEFISDHLIFRDFFFAAHDAGDQIKFEAIMACVCKPRAFFKGETLNRIEETGRYFIERLYEVFEVAPSEEEIEEYMDLLKEGRYEEIDDVLERWRKED